MREAWINLLGSNAIFMRDHTALADIVIGVLKIAEGMSPEQAISESKKPQELAYAIGF